MGKKATERQVEQYRSSGGRKGNTIALEAANPAYETRIFPPDRVKVQGRLVGLLRKY